MILIPYRIYFSHFLGCIFTLLLLSCDAQKFVILITFSLSYSVACDFNVIDKKTLLNPILWRFSPMFSSKSLIVLALTFRFLINFEFIFVYGMREESNFILFLNGKIQLFQHNLLKSLFFPHWMDLAPLSKIHSPQVLGIFWPLNSFALVSMCIFSQYVLITENWCFNSYKMA